MENVIQTTPHNAVPLLYKAAAISVIAAALTGVGAMTGIVPVKGNTAQSVAAQGISAPMIAQPAPTNALAAPAASPLVAQAMAQPAAAPAIVYVPAPEPVAKPKIVKGTRKPVSEPTITASQVSTHPVAVSASGDARYPGERPMKGTNDRAYPIDSYPHTNSPSYPPVVAQAPVKAMCNYCGTVESVREIEKPGDGSGLGAVGGAVGGAVLGRQFGNGRGKDLLSILGAVGGGYAGHQVEKNMRTVKSYEVHVRMEDGSMRTVSSATQPNWRAGDRVRVDGGAISSNFS